MAELTPSERLQPSLLERLKDDEPEKREESRDKRILSMRQLRESVRRDLAWLLNSTNLAAAQDLSDYPEVISSVLNYGMPELSGRVITNLDVARFERQLKQIILDFEPRILAHSIHVHWLVDTEQNLVMFEIAGELWAQPLPQQLYLKTEVDLELGNVRIVDYSVQ